MIQFGRYDPPITTCYKFKKKLLTNADRIRSMTDEELASFAHDHSCIYCPMDDCDGRVNIGRDACYKRWLDWLKQEVKNNE
jgi:hypothetical protein